MLGPLPSPCPRCGYDTVGLEDKPCPECGMPAAERFTASTWREQPAIIVPLVIGTTLLTLHLAGRLKEGCLHGTYPHERVELVLVACFVAMGFGLFLPCTRWLRARRQPPLWRRRLHWVCALMPLALFVALVVADAAR